MTSWPKLLITIASYFIAVPFILALVRYRKLGPSMKPILAYVCLGGIIQISSSYLNSISYNNLWLLHLYTPLEFACIVWFYALVLRGFVKEKAFVAIAAIFTLLSIANTIYLQPPDTFNTYARSLEGIWVILFCLTWCYRTLDEMKIGKLEQNPEFWVNTGFLLYFSGNVLLFAFSNYMLTINRALNLYIWAFHALFSILLYLFITIGLWKVR